MDASQESKQEEWKDEDAEQSKPQLPAMFNFLFGTGQRAHEPHEEPRRHQQSHAKSSTQTPNSPSSASPQQPATPRQREPPPPPIVVELDEQPSPPPSLRLPPILPPSPPSPSNHPRSISSTSSRGGINTTPPSLFSPSRIGLFGSPAPQPLTTQDTPDVVRSLLLSQLWQQQQRLPPLSDITSSLDAARAPTTPCGMSPPDGNTDSPPLPPSSSSSPPPNSGATTPPGGLHYKQYNVKAHEARYLPLIRQLIGKDLSEPYSIYVYRYFLYQWADLCFMALDADGSLIGVIICKLEPHRSGPLRGYIAMLAVTAQHRGQGIATKLVRLAIDIMIQRDADEVALETEITNIPSLRLYESLGFLRSKRLHRYYLNGNAAFRLVLYLKPDIARIPTQPPEYPPDEASNAVPLPSSCTSQELAAENGAKDRQRER